MAREAWERRDDETPPAWQAFTTYRDMGAQRSTAKTGRALGKSKKLMDTWSSKHQWVERCRLWDEETERVAQIEAFDAIKAMSRRHIDIAVAMQVKAAQALQALKPADLNPTQLARFVKDSVMIERLVRGEPTEITEARDEDEAAERLADRLRDFRARLTPDTDGPMPVESNGNGSNGHGTLADG